MCIGRYLSFFFFLNYSRIINRTKGSMHQFRHKRPSFEALPPPILQVFLGWMIQWVGAHCWVLFSTSPFSFWWFLFGEGGRWWAADEKGRKIFSYSITSFQFPIQFLLGPYLITFFWQNWIGPQKKLDRKPKIAKIKGYGTNAPMATPHTWFNFKVAPKGAFH